MLKITLHLNGEKKTFSTNFISGYMFRRALELDEKRNKYLKKLLEEQEPSREEQEELLDELYTFISEVFGQQFSAEEYEKGTDARNIVDQSWAVVHGIINQTMEPFEGVADDDTQKKKSNRRK
ncbi:MULTISPECIES: phage tail assembly chaperone G [Thermoactinomyces]|uniref:Uncharacterized protein n=1 Tax=Thermoactinomyces daqus TaxID=1329516 RepID=A0A7W2AIL0_9BACL|nr:MULTISPECIES: hypothetical protein [Thermoactinomyces]MBA4543856.1 hypothetical protein [Thermoactinomyces daqus]MBH8605988.1 hypothetical protein [Thermoactinomyces sp. CICC 10521]